MAQRKSTNVSLLEMSADAPHLPTSRGAELALLLLDGFSERVDVVVAQLKEAGHVGATANHEFALRAVDAGAGTASDLGRALRVSKQAAAKAIASLEELGYVERRADPSDARRKRLVVTPRGWRCIASAPKRSTVSASKSRIIWVRKGSSSSRMR
ncbi:winged helix DNA-binding protein [Leifsonia sp. F6_8S_P_1B]|uniref:Winged helix DNA-binding protein n=1 Tax=Leifsonia williamsii TaxID=3035919 RepID=A0ABT8K7P5_9MICO|nr:MarR family transcriptional regulator [Leifsonia williamsii]MDN4613182.1 winged helix DNA-binding protein [Leifsonia williamsii]